MIRVSTHVGRTTRRQCKWCATARAMRDYEMDLYMLAGIVMLIAWGGITYTTDAPGWVHLMLTGGVFLIIWRIVVRGTPSGPDHKR